MKYNVHGFNQKAMVNLGMDLTDAAILRYFIDFMDSGSMAIEIIDEKPYYWMRYDAIMKELPIAKLTSKDSVYRRLKKLVESGVLEHKTIKRSGTYSYFRPGPKYFSILSDTIGLISVGGTDEKSEGVGRKVGTNDPSTNNPSTKYKSLYDYYISLSLIKHSKYVPAMTNAMKKAERELGLDIEHMKRMLKRHKQKVEATKDKGKYAVKVRGIKEFFGQKKRGSTDLICADYHDDIWTGTTTNPYQKQEVTIRGSQRAEITEDDF